MKRSAEREALMQMIYQMGVQEDFSSKAKEAFCTSFLAESKKAEYLESTYPLAAAHLDEIDHLIRTNSDNWKLERIAWVDLAILRLAIAEILYIEETPNSVAINEAVELGKKYGTKDSGKFINGVLGKIARNLDMPKED